MTREEIYKSFVIFSMIMLLIGQFISFGMPESNETVDLLLDITTLLLAVSLFLWKPNPVIAVGSLAFSITFNLNIVERNFDYNSETYNTGMMISQTSYYLFIIAIILIGLGWWQESKLKRLKKEHLHPILTGGVLIVVSFCIHYFLRFL